MARRTSRIASATAPVAAGAGFTHDEEDDLPLLESMQELIKREKLALEFQLVEKDETITVLQEKCKALEKTVTLEEQRTGRGGRQRARHWPGSVREEQRPLVMNRQLALSRRNLNARRLAIVNKQYKFLKKQVEGICLNGNGLDDSCIEAVLELIHTKPGVRHLDLSGNNFGAKAATLLLACLRNNRELADKLEVLRLETNGPLSALPAFGADLSRVVKELWDKKILRRLWWLSATLQDYSTGGLSSKTSSSKATAKAAAAASTGGKAAVAAGGKRAKKAKDPMNALALARFLKSKAKPPLHVLELRHARLSPRTVEALCHVESLRSLTYLDLTNAMMGAMGAAALARCLATHHDGLHSLASLSLPGNCIADFGASALAKAVAVSQTLTALDLRHNYIGDQGAADLLAALEANPSLLTSLRLSHNRFSSSVVVKCLRFARLPSSVLTHVDLAGHAGAVLLRSELDEALAASQARLASQCGVSTSSNGAKLLLAWRRGQVGREAFRNAGKDLYVRLLSVAVSDSHFDGAVDQDGRLIDTQEGGGRRPTVLVRLAWWARRVAVAGEQAAEQKAGVAVDEDASGFLWKICRERNGDVTVVARGSGGDRHRRREGGGDNGGWEAFESFFTGVSGGDQLFLQFSACDRYRVALPRQALGEAGGEVEVQGVTLHSFVDEEYGLLNRSHMQAPCSEDEELMAQYSETHELRGAAGDSQRQQVRAEMWKLFLEMGDGRYYPLQEVFVGSGPDVRLSWEAWVEDEEDGGPRAFTWAVVRRSFGSSEIVGRGRAPATDACWVPLEVQVSGCLPGDVLVVWVGVPDATGGEEEDGGGGATAGRRHAVLPSLRRVQLFLQQSDDDRAVMLRQRRCMPSCVLYSCGYPTQAVDRSLAWGF